MCSTLLIDELWFIRGFLYKICIITTGKRRRIHIQITREERVFFSSDVCGLTSILVAIFELFNSHPKMFIY